MLRIARMAGLGKLHRSGWRAGQSPLGPFMTVMGDLLFPAAALSHASTLSGEAAQELRCAGTGFTGKEPGRCRGEFTPLHL